MKVTIKYCTPAMLSALTDLKRGTPVPAPLRETLRARGWINKEGLLTTNGSDMIAKRSITKEVQ